MGATVKRKHKASYEAATKRVQQLASEIEQRREELSELSYVLQSFESSLSLELRNLKEMGITADLFS